LFCVFGGCGAKEFWNDGHKSDKHGGFLFFDLIREKIPFAIISS